MLLISRLIILITFLTIFALAQHQKEDDDDLWPQNYPGHLPTNISIPEGLNRIGSMEEDEDIDDYEELWPQNYPGHVPIPTNITWPPDNSTSEDGEEDKWDNRDNENEHQKGRHSHWWDWLFPWRKHYNRHGKGGHRNQTGNNSTVSLHKVIRISGGRIRGLVSHEAGIDKPALMFKGIPLAEPPVGELRFRPLRKKHPWRHELDATKYSPACLSNTTRTRSPQHYISEDCIYMNVFTDPKCLSGKPCPVLFYIHGGGFVYDSATMFNDTQIVQKYASDGIVFMVPAFRLGVFGYLDLGNDRAVKRNLGMHDIIFALEWAKREARAFGGDPKQITVMGNSAGGSAVAYLCTSPAVSKDHFQQAVISSGVPFFTNNTNLLPSYALLERFNCTGHSNQSSVRRSDRFKAECLRRVDALELLRQQEAIEEQEHLLFAGPETDAELLPARNYAALLKFWKARPLIYVTTKHEYEGPANNKEYTDKSAKLGQHCIQALVPFGLTTPQAFKHCEARYNDTFLTEGPPFAVDRDGPGV